MMAEYGHRHGFTDFDRAVVVDVETTGLDPDRDRIVAICCLRGSIGDLAINGTAPLDYFTARLNPGIPIPREATRIHGITDTDIADAESFVDVAPPLREFIGALPLIGHNISFDKAFLSAEFKRAGQRSLHRNRSFCTMKRLREHLGHATGEWRNLSLEEAAAVFGLSPRETEHHDATEDAMCTLQLAGAMYKIDNGLTDRPPQVSRQPSVRRVWSRAVLAILIAIVIVAILVLVL